MTIPWIKCSERMPQDDDDDVIARWTITNKPEICFGKYMNCKIKKTDMDAHEYEWIPFDVATWRELNDV